MSYDEHLNSAVCPEKNYSHKTNYYEVLFYATDRFEIFYE